MATIGRLDALDLLRGSAVAGMILVTAPGDWAFTYAPLQHAEWNGWTLADLVFPTFLFAVGMALGLSFPRPFDAAGTQGAYWRRVARRVGLLIALGLALEATYTLAIGLGAPFLGKPGLANMRLPGILQRIALCYGLVAVLLAASARRQDDGRREIDARAVGIAIATILIGYWALLRFVPLPGFGSGHLDPEGNLPAWIDRHVFTVAHLWPLGWATPGGPPVYDPEGLLSTLPAAVDTLFGVLAALAWRRQPRRAVAIFAAAGLGLVVLGLLLDPAIVINKRIWTSSFALLSSGMAALALAALCLITRNALLSRLVPPLRVLGGNAILAFVLSTLLGRLYGFPLIGIAGDRISPAAWLQRTFTSALGSPYLASFASAVLVLTVIVLAIWPLHRRGLHLRV